MSYTVGHLIAKALRHSGVTKVFTLCGGHLFPFYDGLMRENIDLIDVRHEQSAGFAAEGFAKACRQVGVAALTAGPGVSNAMSAIITANINNSPVLFLGGRAPGFRWGKGSLQEIDHVAFVKPVSKYASTVGSPQDAYRAVLDGLRLALSGRPGCVFLDVPVDVQFSQVDQEPYFESGTGGTDSKGKESWPITNIVDLLLNSERPVIIAGNGAYWANGEDKIKNLCENFGIPVLLNGLARGIVGADSPVFINRARHFALSNADLVVLVGAPLDFRLNFGETPLFSESVKFICIDFDQTQSHEHHKHAAAAYGDIGLILTYLVDVMVEAKIPQHRWNKWVNAISDMENQLESQTEWPSRGPSNLLHPGWVAKQVLNLMAGSIFIGDGGDFVSFAGKVCAPELPGSWIDAGPYGCLGAGIGYAIGVKMARPNERVVLLAGDGAIGFCLSDLHTLAKHKIPVMVVIGNNGILALEKHPMEALYGYSVASDLGPRCRYDLVAKDLGCDGYFIESEAELTQVLRDLQYIDNPVVLNVVTDPAIAYPRSSVLL